MTHWLRCIGLVTVAACSTAELTISPNLVEFGEIDFNQDKPEAGYNVQEVFLQNTGEDDLELVIFGVDDTRVQLSGQFSTDNPITLMAIGPGQYHTLTLGVIGYDVEAGERDTLVEGRISVDATNLKEPQVLTWSFTPIRVFDNED